MKDTNKKKKKVRIIIFLSILIIALIGVIAWSYAQWQVTKKQTKRNRVGSACISISFENDSGEINVPEAWPMTDEDGEATTPYTFTVTNNCDKYVNYMIALESLETQGNDSSKYVNPNYVKVLLDDEMISTYGSLPSITNDTNTGYTISDTKKLNTRKLYAHQSITHDLRMWLDEDTPESQMNKGFYTKIKILAGQGIELDCFAVTPDGVLTKYDIDCGMSATIPASLNGVAITKIGESAFRSENSSRYNMNEGVDADEIAFSVLIDSDKVAAQLNSDYTTLATTTSSDARIIIYHEKDKRVREIIDNLKESPDELFTSLIQLESFSSFRLDDVDIYNFSNLPERPNGGEYYYILTTENGQTVAKCVGVRYPLDPVFDESTDLNSIDTRNHSDLYQVDLTKATNLAEIGDKAFKGMHMYGLSITFPSSLRTIGDNAFETLYASEINLNSGLLTIGHDAFAEDIYVQTLEIPSSVTSIGAGAWNGSNLTITVHSQDLYNTRTIWAPYATVIYQ